MGYKFKPNKGVAKRMKLTATGKLKHRHEKNSHLRSRRNAALKRRLGRAGVLAEGHSRNLRRFMGVEGVRPNRIAHERALKAAAAEKAGEDMSAENKTPTEKVPVAKSPVAKSPVANAPAAKKPTAKSSAAKPTSSKAVAKK